MSESPSDRLRMARERAGYKTAAAFADVHDLTESTYRSNENGTRPVTMASAKQYAPLLGVSWQWIIDGGAEPALASNARAAPLAKPLEPSQSATDFLPVLGMAECGPDGMALWNGDVVDSIPRPPNLRGAPNAYAVYIVGDSMEPRYMAGELVHVHPGRPVNIGSFVLVQIKPDADGETPTAVVKRLHRRSSGKVVLEQYNPPKKIELKSEIVVSMHRIVGSSDGL